MTGGDKLPVTEPELLPYRPCVGITLINRDGLVWIGKRRNERASGQDYWQMPQGGIDAGENPADAARRELAEETGTGKAEILAQTGDWLTYDLPAELVGIALRGKYRGQKQIWFAMRFLGADADFNIHTPPGGHDPEFDDWRWARADDVVALITPFKRQVYIAVMHEFRSMLR